jgi:DNA primase
LSPRDTILSIAEEKEWISDASWIHDYADHVQISCPFAKYKHAKGTDSHPSMSIDLETGVYRCFTCKQCGDLWEIMAFFSDWKSCHELLNLFDDSVSSRLTRSCDAYEEREVKKKEIDMTPLKKWFMEQSTDKAKIIKYLSEKRGFTNIKILTEIIDLFRIRYSETDKRILIPLEGSRGKFIGLVGRSIESDEGVKYKNYWGTKTTQTFLDGAWLDDIILPNKIIIVEGPLDFLKTVYNLMLLDLYEEVHVVCTFTSKCSAWHFQQLEDWNLPILCFYDSDMEGNKGWIKIHDRLKDRLPSIGRIIPPKDKDAGQYNETEIKSELSRHWKL